MYDNSEITLPALAEGVIEDVVDVAVKDYQWLMSIFMPDGKPFGEPKMSETEQMLAYKNSGLRDDPNVAAQWIRDKVNQLIQQMRMFGVSDEDILRVHPFDIVERAGIIWSYEMEKRLKSKTESLARSIARMSKDLPTIADEEESEPSWQSETISQ